MRVHRTALVLAATVIGLAACADHTTTAPDTGQRGATGTDGVGRAPGDTIAELPSSARVHGRVLGVSVTAPVQGSADTLSFEPVAGAPIKIYRNVLVDGGATQVLAAETISGGSGEYEVQGLEGGYYIIRVTAPAGVPYSDNWEYLAATSSDVEVNVYHWRSH